MAAAAAAAAAAATVVPAAAAAAAVATTHRKRRFRAAVGSVPGVLLRALLRAPRRQSGGGTRHVEILTGPVVEVEDAKLGRVPERVRQVLCVAQLRAHPCVKAAQLGRDLLQRRRRQQLSEECDKDEQAQRAAPERGALHQHSVPEAPKVLKHERQQPPARQEHRQRQRQKP